MSPRIWAVVWAQYRSLRNLLPRSNPWTALLMGLLTLAWYAGFAFLAFTASLFFASPAQVPAFERVLGWSLFGCLIYWQLIPILLASTGTALDLKKLLPYPIPTGQLFLLEVLLRITTGLEVVLVLTGIAAGLVLNPKVPAWTVLPLLVFAAFNLLLSAGTRELLQQILAKKHLRGILVFFFVVVSALPQVLIATAPKTKLAGLSAYLLYPALPWAATAQLASGHLTVIASLALVLWTVSAYALGRWLFERGLRSEPAESAGPAELKPATRGRLEAFYTLPGRLFRDPLAALIEKELRLVSRSGRFRLTFLMGFSFGLLIWLPLAFGPLGGRETWMGRNFLTTVSLYAMLLLGDVLCWNIFGFDRSAAQLYFLAPVPFSTVLLAKNLAGLFWLLVELTMVILVCAVIRMPITLAKVAESYAVTLLVWTFLVSLGNLSSLYNPKPIDPAKFFRQSSAQASQLLLMLSFPVALAPVLLAFAARYAFRSQLAFFGVLLLDALFAAILYRVATASALEVHQQRREAFIARLSGGQTVMSG